MKAMPFPLDFQTPCIIHSAEPNQMDGKVSVVCESRLSHQSAENKGSETGVELEVGSGQQQH